MRWRTANNRRKRERSMGCAGEWFTMRVGNIEVGAYEIVHIPYDGSASYFKAIAEYLRGRLPTR